MKYISALISYLICALNLQEEPGRPGYVGDNYMFNIFVTFGQCTRRTQLVFVGDVEKSGKTLVLTNAVEQNSKEKYSRLTIATDEYEFKDDLSEGMRVLLFARWTPDPIDGIDAMFTRWNWLQNIEPKPQIVDKVYCPGGRTVVVLGENQTEVIDAVMGYHRELRGDAPDFSRYAEFLLSLTTNKVVRLREEAGYDLSLLINGLSVDNLEMLRSQVSLPDDWGESVKAALHNLRNRPHNQPICSQNQNLESLDSLLAELKSPDKLKRHDVLCKMCRDDYTSWLMENRAAWVDEVSKLLAKDEPKVIAHRAAMLLERVRDERVVDFWIEELEHDVIDRRISAWDHLKPLLPLGTRYDQMAHGQVLSDSVHAIRELRPRLPPPPKDNPGH